MLAERLFLTAARMTRRLPNMRGKVRALLALYQWLGLDARHLFVDAVLHRPIPYYVRLDMHSHHERMAFLMDGYEMETVAFLKRLFDPLGCFLDIGANIGLISIPFTKWVSEADESDRARDRAITFCIEAVSSNFDALQGNICANHLQRRVRPLCCAVGEREKVVDIQIEGNIRQREGTGTANILPQESSYECVRTSLQVTTVDHLVEAGRLPPRISLIKIDTDGYDLFAIMGAAGLLQAARPLVFGEFMAHCLNWHGQSVSDVVEFLRPLDYVAFMRIGRSWRFGEIEARHFVQDLLLVPKEKLAGLRGTTLA